MLSYSINENPEELYAVIDYLNSIPKDTVIDLPENYEMMKPGGIAWIYLYGDREDCFTTIFGGNNIIEDYQGNKTNYLVTEETDGVFKSIQEFYDKMTSE